MTLEIPAEVRQFFDDRGRLAQWPMKLKKQLVVLDHLAAQIETGRPFTEKEINARLNELHSFGDWALLRRALCDHRLLRRKSDGSLYWRDPDLTDG